MTEYIFLGIGVVIGSGIALYSKSKSKKSDDIFTIKSDGGKTPKEAPKTFKIEKPNFTPPPQKAQHTLPDEIDMSLVSGIRLEGSTDATITEDTLLVDTNSEVVVKKSTMYITSKTMNLTVNNGTKVINMNSITGSKITIGGITNLMGNVEQVFIPLRNLIPNQIDRVSLKGSGDLVFDKISFSNGTDVILQGSGDINFLECEFGNVVIDLKGSGDINLDRDCKADDLDLNIKGSGDIRISTKQYNAVKQIVHGSGDITLA